MPRHKQGAQKICQVNGCSNSQFKLQQWKKELCPDQGFFRKDCRCSSCDQPYQLHRFPHADQIEWVKHLNTKLTVVNLKDHHRVCSIHFIDGKPTTKHPYPTMHMDYYSLRTNWKPSPGKCIPGQRRRTINVQRNLSKGNKLPKKEPPSYLDLGIEKTNWKRSPGRCNPGQRRRTNVQRNLSEGNKVPKEEPPIYLDLGIEKIMDVVPNCRDSSTQCYSAESVLHDHCYYVGKTTDQAAQTGSVPSIDTKGLNDKQFIFFTGLSSATFWAFLSSIMCWTTELPSHTLPVAEQLLLVLMRLRLGLLLPDLGHRFKMSTSTACKIFSSWITLLGKYSRTIVHWIPRDELERIRPKCFSGNYSKVTCIIGCTDIFVQRPKDLMQREQTYSNCKCHNTYKSLYCIAPNGYVMFVSKFFGGQASDVFITEHSGFLDKLIDGDEVMANRGFTIQDLLPTGVKLTMPELTRHHKDSILPEESETEGRRSANVRIHVERFIRKLKCFRFLSQIIPGNVKNIDDILLICAALCNLQLQLSNDQNSVEDVNMDVNDVEVEFNEVEFNE